MRPALTIALLVALLCAAGGAGAGADGAVAVARAAAAGAGPASVGAKRAAGPTSPGVKQGAGCAKARRAAGRLRVAKRRARTTRAARLRVAKRRARTTRAARRATGRQRMSRKTQRACRGFRPAVRAPVQPSDPAGTPGGVTPSADPSSPSAPPPPPPGGPVVPVVSTLGVSAYDIDGFVLRLTRTSVPAGNLTVFFRNHDVSDHNLWIEGPGGDVLERVSDTVGEDGGSSRTLPVTAGTWRLFCSLPDHGAMTRTLTVTP